LRPDDPAPERGRARRLRRAGLPRHPADGRVEAGVAALRALRGERGLPRAAVLEGVRPPAVRGAGRPLRLLLPDPRQDRAQARLARGRRLRRPLRGGRARPLERQAGDHQLPQDHQAGALHAAAARAPRRAVPAGGARGVLRRHRRCRGADLGHARQLQGGRRGARGHERVGDLAPPERHPARADDLLGDPAPADADHRRLRHERPLPRLRHRLGGPDRFRGHGGRARLDARLFPPQALALSARNALGALAAYVAVSFGLFGLPVVSRFGHDWIGTGADPQIFVWSLAWWPHAVLHWQNPVVTHEVWPPAGLDLTWASSVPALAAALAPVTLSAGTVASYNAGMILAPALAAWTAFLLCRHVTRSFWPSLAGGYLFGFSSYELGHLLGHMNLSWVFLVP